MTKFEHLYANIECEMLAVVFRTEQFRTYVYGRPFTIVSDHKPLESITKKILVATPAQPQHMLLCLQGYNIMFFATALVRDTLSCFKPKPGPQIALDIAIHHICLSPV